MDNTGEQNNASIEASGEISKAADLYNETTLEETATERLSQEQEKQVISKPQASFSNETDYNERSTEKTVSEISTKIISLKEEMTLISQSIGILQGQIEIVQGSLRQLATRVTDVSSSLGAPRIRELYLRLLSLYDLVVPPPIHLSAEAAYYCGLLATQITQFLEVNGVHKIEADRAVFDPQIHKPIEIVYDENTDRLEYVLSIKRDGFRTDMAILRPAEVVLVRRSPTNSEMGDSASTKINEKLNPNGQEKLQDLD